LKSLIVEGVKQDQYISDHKSTTKASHVQLLTGYPPFVTGVWSGQAWQTVPDGLTIFERLKEYYGSGGITNLMVTGKTNQLGNEEMWANALPEIDHYSFNKDTADIVGPIMIDYLQQYGNAHFFALFHFSDPDERGHLKGENSDAYSQAIIDVDYWTGKLIQQLKDLGVYERTIVYVTTDHGFEEATNQHNDAPFIWVVSNDPNMERVPYERQMTPMILKRLGYDVANAIPSFDQPTQYTGNLIGQYFNNSELGNEGWVLTQQVPTIDFDWGLGSPDPRVGPDTFSIIWRGFLLIKSPGKYVFYLKTDDGGRLYIDEANVIDDPGPHLLNEAKGSVYLSIGYHHIKVQYFEEKAEASVKLSWKPPSAPKAIIPSSRLSIEQPIQSVTTASSITLERTLLEKEGSQIDKIQTRELLPDLTAGASERHRMDSFMASVNVGVTKPPVGEFEQLSP